MHFIKKMLLKDKDKTEKLLSSGWYKLKEPSNTSIAVLCSF